GYSSLKGFPMHSGHEHHRTDRHLAKAKWIFIGFLLIAGFFRHCSEDSEINIDRTGCSFYTAGPNLLLKEHNPCSDRVSMSQPPPQASRTLRPSHRLKPWRPAGTSRKRPAHDVAIWPIATKQGSAPYTTWAICPLDVRLIFW